MFRRIAVAVGIVVVIVSTLSLATYLGSRNASVLLADTGKSGDPALGALADLSMQVSMLNKSVSLQQDLITELSGNIVALEAQLNTIAECACGVAVTEVVTVSTPGSCVPLVPITDTSSITYTTIATSTSREPDDDPIVGPPAAPPVAIVPPAVITPTPPISGPVPPPTPPDDDVPPPNDKQHCNQGLGNGNEGCSPGQSDDTVNPDHPHGPNDETEPVTPGQPGRHDDPDPPKDTGRPDDKPVPPGQEDKPCKGNKCS